MKTSAKSTTIKKLHWFKTICDRAGYGVVIRDLTGHFVYVNETFAHMHGYTREELLGQHYSMVHTPEQVDLVESLEEVRQAKGGFIAEIGHKRKDGSTFPTLMNGIMLKDKLGNHIYNTATLIEITELKKRDRDLKRNNRHLEEANTALRVLMKRSDLYKRELEEQVVSNVKELVEPVLERLKQSRLDRRQQTYVSILESHLNEIISPFAHKLKYSLLKLTPTESQVASLIREGKTTKEIGDWMNLSPRTVEFHRKNIRKKFGLTNKKKNLRTHLLSLS
jgi:PAS domain S-box-containing protein